MENIILILILAVLVGGAAFYIYKEKKKGTVCIGCPHSKTCKSHKCNGSCKDNIRVDK